MFGLNELEPKPPEKILIDRNLAQSLQGWWCWVGGSRGGAWAVWDPSPPPPPSGAELFKGALATGIVFLTLSVPHGTIPCGWPSRWSSTRTCHMPPTPTTATCTTIRCQSLCTAKKPPIYGHGDTLHCQKAPHIWTWGHFPLAKSPPYMGMGTLCTAKKPPIYGHGDTFHCQKAPHIWAWGHFALPKSPPYMGMGTLCTGKKPPIYGHGDTFHCQKAPHIWAWGHFALPKSPPYMGRGTLCTAKKPPIYGHGDTLHCQKATVTASFPSKGPPSFPVAMSCDEPCTASPLGGGGG